MARQENLSAIDWRSLVSGGLCAWGAFVLTSIASAQTPIQIQELGTLPGSPVSEATAISPSGEAVGKSGSTGGYLHAVLFDGVGTVLDLGTLGGPQIYGLQSFAEGINDKGEVVGRSQTVPNFGYTAFRWREKDGLVALPSLPGGTNSEAYGINRNGQIVGSATTQGAGYPHPVLWDGSSVLDLGTLGGLWGTARAINTRTQIVGYTTNAGGQYRAFFWEKDVMTDLGTLPGYRNSYAYDVNEKGQITGHATPLSGYPRAVIWDKGQILALPLPAGAIASWGRGISDQGQVVGDVRLANNEFRAFVWDPDVGTLILPTLPGGTESSAMDCVATPGGRNAGGLNLRIVGYSRNSIGYNRAVIWTL